MGIDARIPLSAFIPQPFDAMAARRDVARTKQDEAEAAFTQERTKALQQSRADEARMRAIVQSTNGDLQAASKALLAQGDIARGSALQSELDKMDAAKLQRTINTYREHEAHVGLLGQVLGSAKDQPSYDLARQQLTKMGMDTSDLGDTFDAGQVASVRQMGMTAAEQIRDAREQAEATWRKNQAEAAQRRLDQTDARDADRYTTDQRRLDAAEARDAARAKNDARRLDQADTREQRMAQATNDRAQYGRDMVQLRRDAERRQAGSATNDPTLKQDFAEYKGYLDEHEAQQRLENQYATDPHYQLAQPFDAWRRKVKGRAGTATPSSAPANSPLVNPRRTQSRIEQLRPGHGSGQQQLASPTAAQPNAPQFKVGDPVRLKDGSTGVIKGINPATGKYIIGTSTEASFIGPQQ